MPFLTSLPMGLLLKGIAILAIIAAIWWKISSLNSTIEQLEADKVALQQEIVEVNVDLLTQKNNVLTLENTIKDANALVSQLQIENNDIEAKLKEWEKNPRTKVVERIVTKYEDSKQTCQDLAVAIEEIANINYEDLK